MAGSLSTCKRQNIRHDQAVVFHTYGHTQCIGNDTNLHGYHLSYVGRMRKRAISTMLAPSLFEETAHYSLVAAFARPLVMPIPPCALIISSSPWIAPRASAVCFCRGVVFSMSISFVRTWDDAMPVPSIGMDVSVGDVVVPPHSGVAIPPRPRRGSSSGLDSYSMHG